MTTPSPRMGIAHVDPAQPHSRTTASGVIWEGIDEIHIALGDAHWYGQGGLVHQQWPLERIAMYPAPFVTSDNGHTGLLGILEPFWFNSQGTGIAVESHGSQSLEVSFNAPLSGEPPGHSFQDPAHNDLRPILANQADCDGLLKIRGENLTVTFYYCENARDVVEAFWLDRDIPEAIKRFADIRPSLFEKPLWTTWAYFKNDINHANVIDYARQLAAHDFTASIFGVDAKWQHQFGDTRFDTHKFPNPATTIATLHEIADAVTLWSVPFFMEDSMHFVDANQHGYTLRRPDGSPYIGEWWEGKAAFLDVTYGDALTWHLDNLQELAKQVGVDGFKFDAGEGMFYLTPNAVWHAQDQSPNAATYQYVHQVARRFPWSDVRSGWQNQHDLMLFRQWDKSTRWGFDNGLASCITQAMTLNMLGYPVSFPDMIGGNEYTTRYADAELLIRWTQAVAPMPLIQFSIPPWKFDAETIAICRRYTKLHRELAPRHLAILAKCEPLIRPLWWIAPADEQALVCADEYLVGNDLLVAPIVTPNADRRDVYLPAGHWRNYWQPSETHKGGRWLYNFPAPLDVLPLFVREG